MRRAVAKRVVLYAPAALYSDLRSALARRGASVSAWFRIKAADEVRASNKRGHGK